MNAQSDFQVEHNDAQMTLQKMLDQQVEQAKQAWKTSCDIYDYMKDQRHVRTEDYRRMAIQAKELYLVVHLIRHNVLSRSHSLK